MNNPKPNRRSNAKLNEARKEILFSELFSLLSAGLDFSRSFELLIAGEKDAKIRQLLQQLYDAVIRGETLGTAFEQSKRFSTLDCGVLRIGEETGRLAESLSFLSEFYHKKIEQRRMVSGAVSYPLIVLGTAVVVVIFMVLVIVPMFEQVYARMGGELPALTQAIIRFSKDFPTGLALGGTLLATGMILLSVFRENRNLRKTIAALMMHTPILGEILSKNHQAHFCKLLYLLIGSGVPLLRSMDMLGRIITFYPYQQSFGTICQGLRNGERFADNMAHYEKLYDMKLITLVRVGEETNRLPEMLRKQGQDLNKELEFKLKYLGNVLEPMLILLVGVLVAVVLIAMYLPMFKLGGIMY